MQIIRQIVFFMPRESAGNVSSVVPAAQSAKKGMINSSASRFCLKSKNHGSKALTGRDSSASMRGVDYAKAAFPAPNAFRYKKNRHDNQTFQPIAVDQAAGEFASEQTPSLAASVRKRLQN